MNANKMKTPLYWCMKPIIILEHSLYKRSAQALKGLGAPVRMVILPKEAHSYKENILHLLWEQDQFLEKYLKNIKKTKPRNTKFQGFVYAIIKVTSSFNSNGTSCSKKTIKTAFIK
jgi:hypothetical protein